MPLIRSLGKGKGAQHLLSSYCVPSPWCPLILKGPWEVTAATLLCRGGNGDAGRDSGQSCFGTSQPRAQVLATPKPSTWRAVEVRHRLRRLGAARVLRESPAATHPSVLVASLPGPPRAAGGSLAQPPRWPFLHLGYVRLVTCQERETDLLPGHSQAMAWGLCELTDPPWLPLGSLWREG